MIDVLNVPALKISFYFKNVQVVFFLKSKFLFVVIVLLFEVLIAFSIED